MNILTLITEAAQAGKIVENLLGSLVHKATTADGPSAAPTFTAEDVASAIQRGHAAVDGVAATADAIIARLKAEGKIPQ